MPCIAGGLRKWRCAQSSAANHTSRGEGPNANNRPLSGSIAHTTPAATIGDATRGGAAFHATVMDDAVSDSATSPSVHGTHTIDPDHAVPPNAAEHTDRLAIWPPIPPSWSAFSRYAMP